MKKSKHRSVCHSGESIHLSAQRYLREPLGVYLRRAAEFVTPSKYASVARGLSWASSLDVVTLVETFVFRTSVFYWSSFLPEMVVVFCLSFVVFGIRRTTGQVRLCFCFILSWELGFDHWEYSLWSLPAKWCSYLHASHDQPHRPGIRDTKW